LTFFLHDDQQLNDIKEKYKTGKMLTGEVKKILSDVLGNLVDRHQEARASVTEEMIDTFLAVRKITF